MLRQRATDLHDARSVELIHGQHAFWQHDDSAKRCAEFAGEFSAINHV
jgi:hypothetical protein